MDISVEITGSLARRLTVAVPAEQLKEAVQKRIQKLSKTAKLDGFRPGKIPLKVIEQRFGDAIRGEAIEEILQSSLKDALKQENLQPAEPAMIQSLEAEEGQPLKYSATFEVYPEIQVSSMADVTLEKTVVTIQDSDIAHVLEQMRKQHAEWEEVSRPAQLGDKLTVDFTRITDGQAQADSEQKNVAIILDEKHMPAEFNKLIGAKTGDELTVDLPAPTGHAATAPQQAHIKIHKIETPILPEINDEFAKKLGVETVDELRQEVRSHMEKELNNVLKNKLKNQLVDKLIEKNPVELPKALVEKEREHLEKEWLERMRQTTHHSDIHLQPEAKERSLKVARRRVTLSLLFAEIIRQHNMQVDQNRVQEHIMQIVGAFEDPKIILNMIQKQPELLQGIRSQVMEEQVVDKLLEQVQYTEKTASYNEVMQFGSGAGAEVEHEHHIDHHHFEHDHEHGEHCDHDH